MILLNFNQIFFFGRKFKHRDHGLKFRHQIVYLSLYFNKKKTQNTNEILKPFFFFFFDLKIENLIENFKRIQL